MYVNVHVSLLLLSLADSPLLVGIELPARAGAGRLGGPQLHLDKLCLLCPGVLQGVVAVGSAVGVDDAVLDLLHLVEDGGDEVHAPGLDDVVTGRGVPGVSLPGVLTHPML